MKRRILFAASLAAGVLAVGLLGVAPAADTASAAAKKRDSSRSYVLESRRRYKRRPRTQKIPLPVGPAYVYYDYPYYYARGHYPTHIGGYVYYYPPGVYSYGPTRRHKGRGK